MKRLLLGLTAVLAGCPGSTPDPVRTWFPEDFLAGRHPRWAEARLFAVPDGGVVPWTGEAWGTPEVVAGGPSLVPQPGYVEGQPVAFVITDAWQDHPSPWVQPVYAPRQADGSAVPDALPLFGQGTDSTFYSPYWFAHVVTVTAGTTAADLTTVRGLTAHQASVSVGPGLLCPIAPEGTRVVSTQADGGVHHPLLPEVPLAAPLYPHAWVEGRRVAYVHFGADRFPFNPEYQLPQEADAWFFVTGDDACDTTEFRVPPVLPDDADHHAYVRRIEVKFDLKRWAVFLPAGQDVLRHHLEACGVRTVTAPASVDAQEARRAQGKVLTDDGCLRADGGVFPDGCAFLDREAALGALSPAARVETTTTLTLVPLRALP